MHRYGVWSAKNVLRQGGAVGLILSSRTSMWVGDANVGGRGLDWAKIAVAYIRQLGAVAPKTSISLVLQRERTAGVNHHQKHSEGAQMQCGSSVGGGGGGSKRRTPSCGTSRTGPSPAVGEPTSKGLLRSNGCESLLGPSSQHTRLKNTK